MIVVIGWVAICLLADCSAALLRATYIVLIFMRWVYLLVSTARTGSCGHLSGWLGGVTFRTVSFFFFFSFNCSILSLYCCLCSFSFPFLCTPYCGSPLVFLSIIRAFTFFFIFILASPSCFSVYFVTGKNGLFVIVFYLYFLLFLVFFFSIIPKLAFLEVHIYF